MAISYILSYVFSFVGGLVFLPLLPDQKADTQARKRSRPRATIFAAMSIVLLSVSILYSVVVNSLSVFPATSCLQIAGGDGCDLQKEPFLVGGPHSGNATTIIT